MDIEKLYEEVVDMKVTLQNHEQRLITVEEAVKDNHKIATNVEIIAVEFKHMRNDMSELKNGQESIVREVEEIKNSSDKSKASFLDRLKENIVWYIVAAALASTITYIAS